MNAAGHGPNYDHVVRAVVFPQATPRINVLIVVVFVSRDGRWRLEQAPKEIRVLTGSRTSGWSLVKSARTTTELARWLKEQGDPVDEWVPG